MIRWLSDRRQTIAFLTLALVSAALILQGKDTGDRVTKIERREIVKVPCRDTSPNGEECRAFLALLYGACRNDPACSDGVRRLQERIRRPGIASIASVSGSVVRASSGGSRGPTAGINPPTKRGPSGRPGPQGPSGPSSPLIPNPTPSPQPSPNPPTLPVPPIPTPQLPRLPDLPKLPLPNLTGVLAAPL